MHNTRTPEALICMALLWLSAWAAGCSGAGTQEGCQVDADCGDAALVCVQGACLSCQGKQGCACTDQGLCDPGLQCLSDTCQPEGACATGAQGCPCYGNGTCDGALACDDQRLCQSPEVACEAGSFNCPCYGNDTCDDGLSCHSSGRCVTEGCQEGQQGCPCLEDDTCAAGLTCDDRQLCAARACQESQAGQEGCDCRAGDDQAPCDAELYCASGNLCAACQPGEGVGCACLEDDTCQGALVCDVDQRACREPLLCADLGCATNQLCQEAEGGQDALCLALCDHGLIWDADGGLCGPAPEANCQEGASGSLLEPCAQSHRLCVEVDSGATCGACLGGYLEEDGACRPVLTCAEADCQSQHRDCQAATQASDAACGACMAGYQEEDGACAPTPASTCGQDAYSILADCAAQHRACEEDDQGARCGACLEGYGDDPDTMTCVQRLCADLGCQALGLQCDGEPLAACGGCLEGLIPDPTREGTCVAPLGCDEITCDEDSFCVATGTQDAFCAAWPCVDAENQPDTSSALRQDSQQCVTCQVDCQGEGLTGRIWHHTLEGSDTCLCETTEGHYLDPAQPTQAQPCDADQDGWLRLGARDALESPLGAIAQNARCQLRQIDQVVLRNELGQELPLALCQGDPVRRVACDPEEDGACGAGTCDAQSLTCACAQSAPLPLYESDRNDDQSALEAAGLPALGGQGRALVASELNPLTRACASAQADHNDNGQADLEEHQGMALTQADPALAAFGRFTYLIELHEGSYRAPEQGQEHGAWVIAEKRRCDPGFPLTYDAALDPSDYWRGCTRLRDAGYDADAASLTGYDFAAWSCEEASGTCGVDPVTDQSAQSFVAPHDLCDDALTLPPSDGVWRGMQHHSQFKCVQLAQELPQSRDEQSPQVLALEEVANQEGQGGYQLQSCQVACPETDQGCALDCDDQGRCAASSQGLGGEPGQPQITCQALGRQEVQAGHVGLASVRFLGGGDYQRGCLDEGRRWPQLCPGYSDSLEAALASGDAQRFGALTCGCGLQFGGQSCERSCQDEALMVGGDGDGDDCVEGYCLRAGQEGDELLRSGWWSCARPWLGVTQDGDGNLDNALRGQGWTERGSIEPGGLHRQWRCEDEDCGSGWSIR
jgi:hypothetical protein